MSTERRDFLKLFGVTSAAFAATVTADTPTGTDTKFEAVRDVTVHKLAEPKLPTMDVRRMQLYSALDLDSENLSERHEFFRVPVYQTSRHLADTNLYNACRLDMPEKFLVQRIGVTFAPGSDERDINNFASSYALSLWLGHKYYFRAPVAHMFSSGEVGGNGRFADSAMKGFCELAPLPIIIESLQQFHGDVVGNSFRMKGKLRLWMVLDGLHALGVQ